MDHSFIFWYTGWVIWAVIGAALAIIVLIAFILGAIAAYNGGRQWQLVTSYLRMSDEERQVFHAAAVRLVSGASLAALNDIFKKHRELLKLLPRGKRLEFDTSFINKDAWYELNDGSVGRIYSVGGADYLADGDRTYGMKLTTGQDIKLRADGVCEDQPALMVIRKCEKPNEK